MVTITTDKDGININYKSPDELAYAFQIVVTTLLKDIISPTKRKDAVITLKDIIDETRDRINLNEKNN